MPQALEQCACVSVRYLTLNGLPHHLQARSKPTTGCDGSLISCVVSQQDWGYWMWPQLRQRNSTTGSMSTQSTTNSSIISPRQRGQSIGPPLAQPPKARFHCEVDRPLATSGK